MIWLEKTVKIRLHKSIRMQSATCVVALFRVIGNCDAISYYTKTLREDAQTAEMELIATQYRGRARVLQAKLFVPLWENLFL